MYMKKQRNDIQLPTVPDSLKNRLEIVPSCEFTQQEIKVFSDAFRCLEIYLSQRNDPYPNMRVVLLFMDASDVTVTMDDDGTMGEYIPIIFYPLHKIRIANCTDNEILAIALEELCHCFFMEHDEEKIMYIVLEAAHCLFPGLGLEELYQRLTKYC